jgi:proline dehydrogenase
MKHWMTTFPPVRQAARRFVAGERLEEAIEAIRALNRQGILATLDHLGENTQTREDAVRAADEYLRILDAIRDHGLRSSVSLKLTQMGLDLDESFGYQNTKRIVEKAKEHKNFVRIDMESSAYTDRTLTLYERLRREGYGNVGVVIQSYLYRSERDVERLIELGANVRLCKGAYAEPPAVAFPRKRDVDRNFLKLLEKLWGSEARARGVYVAVATHDERIIRWAKIRAQELGISRDEFEFQMLYGIRRDLQQRLVGEGYRVRVYVSYGREWYPYFMRRLAERPANLLFLARHLVRA